MTKFERLDGPCGIPVFHQRLPDVVRSSGIALSVFTGSADDTFVGNPGLYHWFEHVPFRGTKKFPGGYASTKGPITLVGGKISAWTNPFCTNYWATLPTRHLQVGAEIIIDMVAEPLLTEEAIVAEREIINQEIRDKMGSDVNNMIYRIPPILFRDHPLGNPTLGSIDSLSSMNPDLLIKAREAGYDRSRMAFFASTSLPSAELLNMLTSLFETLPSNGVSGRIMNASFGPLPWSPGEETTFETSFSSSLVKVLFASKPFKGIEGLAKRIILNRLFGHGGNGAPLSRAVREKNPLAYNAVMESFNCADGGCWGFQVKTSKDNVEAVKKALPTMLDDPQLRSREWFEGLKEAARCGVEMEVIDPENLVESAVKRTITFGRPVDEEEVIDIILGFSHEEVMSWVDEIRFEEARTVVALGKG